MSRPIGSFHRWMAVKLASLVLPFLALPAHGEVLSDNLTNVSSGVESAIGSTWLAGGFGTGSSAVNLGSVTLLLANPTSGTAEVSIYADGGLQPGSLVGTLTSPTSYSVSLAETTFLAENLSLAPNSDYWLVLQATSGQFDWSWTADNTGTGVGFQHTWGISDTAGSSWFTFDRFPTQFRVSTATVITGDFNGDGVYDCLDVDGLVVEIAGSTHNPSFDLTGDGLVDTFDLDAWLAEAGAVNLPSQNSYLYGDANLDGVVDGSDFGTWNANKFTNLPAWCAGDFNADGVVDGSDFSQWNANKFTSATAPVSVPEPTLGIELLPWLALVVTACFRPRLSDQATDASR